MSTQYVLPDMPSTFFNSQFFQMFEGFVRWFMKYNMPIFMLCMAVLLAYLVLDMIGDVNVEAKTAVERRRHRSDDDDD